MLAAVRRRRILDLLAQREYVTVGEARTATGASMATTQRDLAHLATAGALTRIHGGATRPPQPGDEGTTPGAPGAPNPARAHDEGTTLVACLGRAHRALDTHDLDAAEAALRQALEVCHRLRGRPSTSSARGGGAVTPRR